MKELTFGSLFAGVGGFDMGMEQAGWACKFQVEWDKNCQNILKKHWPDVPKWGDVSDVDGAVLPPVDCIVFGSPCQDLSVAGKRAGLEGERSGLFHEATRIIKEMRYATNGTFPRWAIWENVAGALSSNKGADFATVLYQMGEAGAVEQWWNILDAQFFGVPQRRRRIFLLACFNPATAARCPEALLPVAESLPGHLTKSKPQRKSATSKTSESVGGDGGVINTLLASTYHHGGVTHQDANSDHLLLEAPEGEWWDGQSTAATLTTNSNDQRMPDKGHLPVVVQETIAALTVSDLVKGQTSHQAIDSNLLQVVDREDAPICIDRSAFNQGPNAMYDTHISDDPIVPTLVSRGPHAVFTKSRHAQSATDDETWVEGQVNPTLNAFEMGDTRTATAVVEPIYFADDRRTGPKIHDGTIPTLQAFMGTGGNNTPMVATPVGAEQTVYAFDSLSSNSMKSANPDSGVNEVDVAKTLDTWRPDPSLNQGGLAIVEGAISPMLLDIQRVGDIRVYSEPVQTLQSRMGTGGNATPMIAEEVTYSFDTQFGSNANVTENISPTLKASQQSPSIAYPIQDGRDIEKQQNGLGVGDALAPSYTITATGGQAVAYSIREDAKANTFSATELDYANALSALRPSPQSHHAQMFITEVAIPIDTRNALRDPDKYDEQNRQGLGVGADGDVSGTVTSAFIPAVAYDGYNQKLDESDVHRSLRVGRDSSDFVAQPIEPTVFQPGTMLRLGGGIWEGTVPTLRAEAKRGDNEPHLLLDNSQPVMPTILAGLSHLTGTTQDGYIKTIHDVQPSMAVRRLTPLECERLMGWPDHHTRWKADGTEQADSHRYKQCGNGVATPVAKWIGEQIAKVEHG